MGALGTVTEGLVTGQKDLKIRGRVKTIQTTLFLRSAWILRRVLETWGDYCRSNSNERPSSNADVKNTKGVKCEKRDKYLDLARELKKLLNMKVTIIPIVIGALGTVTKGLVQGLEDW